MQNFKDGVVPVGSNKLSALIDFANKSLQHLYSGDELENIIWWLAEHVSGVKKSQWITNPNMQVNQSVVIHFCNGIDALMKGMPVQYVIGEVNFLGFKLKLNSSVLIPRPETEELVDFIIRENRGEENLKILDIGTGSGCIAISLAGSLHIASVIGIDKSKEALMVARENSKLNKIQNVEWKQLDILIEAHLLSDQFDIIVSNPPYISWNEKEQMNENVLNFEPHMALFADEHDPLIFYRHIALIMENSLKPNGRLYLEINEHYANETAEIFTTGLVKNVSVLNDMFGKPRFIKLIRL